MRRHLQTFQAIARFGEAGFFFFGGFDDFILREFGFGGWDGAAFGAGDDKDDLAEAGVGVMSGEFGHRLKWFEEGGVGADTHTKDGVLKHTLRPAGDVGRTGFAPDIPTGFPQ